MNDWTTDTLDKYLDKIIGGGTPPRTTEAFWEGNIKWASVKDFKEGKNIILNTQETISKEGLRNSASNLVPSGIPILCTRMAVGRIAFSHYDLAINQDLKALFPNDRIYSEFLLILLHFHREGLSNKAIGSTVKGISLVDLRRFSISVPPLPQQKKIAKILSTCDEVIEQTEAAIAKYEAIKQGMMQDLFTRGIDIKTGQLRPTYEQAPDRCKESELGMIPKEWEVKSMSAFLEMKSGETITSKGINDFGPYPVYGGNGLRGYTNSYTHDGNYILYGRQGALCGNVNLATSKFYASEHAVVVTIIDDSNIKWLENKLIMMNLNQYSEASAQPGLSVGKILKLILSVPSSDEQNLIGKSLISIESKIEKEKDTAAKYSEVKQGLMQDLLTGKVEVTV